MTDIDQLVESLASEKIKVKPALHPYELGLKWMGAGLAYLVVSLLVTGLRPDFLDALTGPFYVAELVLLLVIFCTTAISAGLLSFPDLYQKKKVALLPAWIFGTFVLLMLLSWLVRPTAPPPDHSWQCTLSITAFALLPAGWTFYVMRNYASTHTDWAGSITLLSAFSIGALWLRLHEQNDSIEHVMAWHYLPMLAVVLFGLLLGKRLLKW